jgi:type I restriction enzyme S subunit
MKCSFKDIVIDSRTGLNPRKNFVLGSGDNAYITIKDIYDGKINISDKTDRVDDAAIQTIKKRSRIAPGDILFVSIGRIGETAIVQEKDDSWDVNESVFIFTINDDIIIPEYFCLLFESEDVRNSLTKNSSGSTFKSIKMGQLERMEFDIPSLNEQKNIVDQINKIKSIRIARIKELEQLDLLIKARFVEMFGDENNSLNWDMVNVEDVADVQVGVVIKPSQYYTGKKDGIPAFRSLNIGEGFIKNMDWVYFSQEGNDKNSKSILKENDLLIVRSGAPGTACVVTKEFEGYNAIDIIIAHPDCSKVNPYYLCTYTNMPHGKKQIQEGTGGAAQQHFNVGKYNKLKLMLPPVELQNEFVGFIKQVDKSKFEGRMIIIGHR